MVDQIQRSVARKGLTRHCSNLIKEIIASKSNTKTGNAKLAKLYRSASRIALGVSIERLTNHTIPKSLTTQTGALSLFSDELDHIASARVREQQSVMTKSLIKFIDYNRNFISEEDLGGISELISGHIAVWEGGDVQFKHNPVRRGAGKIYTPFDVTSYMCELISKDLVLRAESITSLLSMRVLDPAIGSGAFTAQFVRVLWRKAKKKWKLENEDENEFRKSVCELMIHGCDIDDEALDLAKAVMWISAGCPKNGLTLNFFNGDSLKTGPCPDIKQWGKYTNFDVGTGYDAVFGNPPYVRVRPSEISKFSTNRCRNLYSAFTELSINLLNNEGSFSFIVPQSIVVSNDADCLRKYLLKQAAEIRLQIFDSVPDFLFDQGKIESNSNTSINQRTAIIYLNRRKPHSLYTSPLLRWRRKERNDLFNQLKQVKIKDSDLICGKIPMLENKSDLNLLRRLRKQKHTIGDKLDPESSNLLYIPKAVRYFITAVPFDLERSATVLPVAEEFHKNIHCILNSNLFYWWWRIIGNGFQVGTQDITEFPFIAIEDEKAISLSGKLEVAVPECSSFKHNSGGDQHNVNYNYRQDILQEIDLQLVKGISIKRHDRIFQCKANSLHGDMSKLVGYNDKQQKKTPLIPGIIDEEEADDMKIEVKSITNKRENALIRMSTIQGWNETDIPKLLIVFDSENKRSPPIKRADKPSTKSRDLEVKIVGYTLHYFSEESATDFVEMPSNFPLKEITSIKHRENPDEYEKMKNIVDSLNEQSDAKIKLKVEKNGQNSRVHYQCKRNLLPNCPPELYEEIKPKVDKLIGCQLRLWKNLEKLGYKDGYLDEDMVHWEEDNKKSTGILYALLPVGIELKFPEFKHGKQDYWGGFALELILDDLNKAMSLTPGGTMGQDLALKTLDNWKFIPEEEELKFAAKKFGKHKILRELQSLLDIKPLDSDISKGSTVTHTGLKSIAEGIENKLSIKMESIETKAKCIRSMLSSVGGKSDKKDVSKGGTVTAYALYKIYSAYISAVQAQSP